MSASVDVPALGPPQIVEVLLRDGLQNEPVHASTADKVRWAVGLVAAGARRIEAVSFVHPRLVPAMADAEAVMDAVRELQGTSWAGLVLNRRGLERAVAAGVDEVNVVVCVSDTFSHRNQNTSTEASLDAALEVVSAARAQGLVTTATLATAFGCPFEGEVDPERVASLAAQLAQAAPDEICLADTIGVGVPRQVNQLAALVTEAAPDAALRFHFHDTRNTGTANAWAALAAGATALDASAGGYGGCPFAPEAGGNLATEDLVYLLERSGVATGLDSAQLGDVTADVARVLGTPPRAALTHARAFPVPEPEPDLARQREVER